MHPLPGMPGVETYAKRPTLVSSGRVFAINARTQQELLHTCIILVIVKQHLVQIGRIDGPTEYLISSLLLSSLELSDTTIHEPQMRALLGNAPHVRAFIINTRRDQVYACPPSVCGGSLDWLEWQEEAASRVCAPTGALDGQNGQIPAGGPASGSKDRPASALSGPLRDGGCLWVDSMACHFEADVVILTPNPSLLGGLRIVQDPQTWGVT